jgi:hypothetical protein
MGIALGVGKSGKAVEVKLIVLKLEAARTAYGQIRGDGIF